MDKDILDFYIETFLNRLSDISEGITRCAIALEEQNKFHEARNKTLKENAMPPMVPK